MSLVDLAIVASLLGPEEAARCHAYMMQVAVDRIGRNFERLSTLDITNSTSRATHESGDALTRTVRTHFLGAATRLFQRLVLAGGLWGKRDDLRRFLHSESLLQSVVFDEAISVSLVDFFVSLGRRNVAECPLMDVDGNIDDVFLRTAWKRLSVSQRAMVLMIRYLPTRATASVLLHSRCGTALIAAHVRDCIDLSSCASSSSASLCDNSGTGPSSVRSNNNSNANTLFPPASLAQLLINHHRLRRRSLGALLCLEEEEDESHDDDARRQQDGLVFPFQSVAQTIRNVFELAFGQQRRVPQTSATPAQRELKESIMDAIINDVVSQAVTRECKRHDETKAEETTTAHLRQPCRTVWRECLVALLFHDDESNEGALVQRALGKAHNVASATTIATTTTTTKNRNDCISETDNDGDDILTRRTVVVEEELSSSVLAALHVDAVQIDLVMRSFATATLTTAAESTRTTTPTTVAIKTKDKELQEEAPRMWFARTHLDDIFVQYYSKPSGKDSRDGGGVVDENPRREDEDDTGATAPSTAPAPTTRRVLTLRRPPPPPPPKTTPTAMDIIQSESYATAVEALAQALQQESSVMAIFLSPAPSPREGSIDMIVQQELLSQRDPVRPLKLSVGSPSYLSRILQYLPPATSPLHPAAETSDSSSTCSGIFASHSTVVVISVLLLQYVLRICLIDADKDLETFALEDNQSSPTNSAALEASSLGAAASLWQSPHVSVLSKCMKHIPGSLVKRQGLASFVAVCRFAQRVVVARGRRQCDSNRSGGVEDGKRVGAAEAVMLEVLERLIQWVDGSA